MGRERISRNKNAGEKIVVDIASITTGFWTQGYDIDPLAFDELTVVDGAITCTNPTLGANNLSNVGAYHGCCFHDFGPGWEDNFEVEIQYLFKRPMEASPLLSVVTSDSDFGAGMWQGNDLFPGPPITPIWLCGFIGSSNAAFRNDATSTRVLTNEEILLYSSSWRPFPQCSMIMRKTGGFYTLALNGRWLPGLKIPVPPALASSTTHGFCIDGNQLDGNHGAGGYRPPNWPAIAANLFTIRKL